MESDSFLTETETENLHVNEITSEQVLEKVYLDFKQKNGVVCTCSSTFRYQQVKDGAKVDLRRPGIQRSNWHNLRNTKPRNGTGNMINPNKVHQEVNSSEVSLDQMK